MNLFNYNQTFKPVKKVAQGTIRYDLHKVAQDKVQESHTSNYIFEVVQLPKDGDINEWFAVHVIDFYNKVNLYFGNIIKSCNCKTMCAGTTFNYLWKDSDAYKKATELPAST